MKQQIRKPENWQDFEELCKILWEEIWDCPEIKKNGRSGQNQKGVDIYGIPKGEIKYYGIQCKGKDEYIKSSLTEKEIMIEIEKAKQFLPALKKFYFATTANKDERIEEFIRLKNVEHIEQGIFEVHLFCWEDISYLIDRYKRAHDWYIRKIDFASNFKVSVFFDNEDDAKEFQPILLKSHIKYKYQKDDYRGIQFPFNQSPKQKRAQRIEIATDPQPVRYFVNGTSVNKSSCVFSVRLTNIGNLQLENFKLYLTLPDDDCVSELVGKQTMFLESYKYKYNGSWVTGKNELEFTEENGILVQKDVFYSDRICIRPKIEYPFCLIIHWKLVAKDFAEQGVLKVIFNTGVKEKHSVLTYGTHFDDEVILENYTGHDD